jgi:hypothetical protein
MDDPKRRGRGRGRKEEEEKIERKKSSECHEGGDFL